MTRRTTRVQRDRSELKDSGNSGLQVSNLFHLVRLAESLGAAQYGGPLSPAERELLAQAQHWPCPSEAEIANVVRRIREGHDPLGDALSQARKPRERRRFGQFLTPDPIVKAMVEWTLRQGPAQVVDAGAGTGRFAAAILRRSPETPVYAIELDPVASLLCRAHLAQLPGRATVVCADYLTWTPPPAAGPTAYIGNPPYVRHHSIDPGVKTWLDWASIRLERPISKLAGLHAYFIISTALKARRGDPICFVTSAEWLDVRYGEVLRWLLLEKLGLESLHLLTPTASAFPDAMSTAVILCARAGEHTATVRLRLVTALEDFVGLAVNGQHVSRAVLVQAPRWSSLLQGADSSSEKSPLLISDDARMSSQYLPLRVIARVHRGVATGANAFFVLPRERAQELGLSEFCVPCITRAEQILTADGVISETMVDHVLLLIPPELRWEDLPESLRAYLKYGEDIGVAQRYLCRHRRPWWSLGRYEPPPIVMTYMARRAPAFALNPDGLMILNIAHGIYPNRALSRVALEQLVYTLNECSKLYTGYGRTYQGGLLKFEPKEIEQLPIPKALLVSCMETDDVATVVR